MRCEIGPSKLSCLGSSVVERSVQSVECCGFESHLRQMGEYVSTQTLVINHWAGPSVIAHLAPDSTPDRAE